MTERPKSSPGSASANESIVVVIDDDASVRRALTNLFESIGLKVEVFAAQNPGQQASGRGQLPGP